MKNRAGPDIPGGSQEIAYTPFDLPRRITTGPGTSQEKISLFEYTADEDSSERMAAYTFLDQWNPQSIRNDQEFGTIIVKRGNKFAALGVVPGEQDTLFGLEPYLDSFQRSGPLDTQVTAWAHTHSRWGSNLSGYFGRGDVVFTNENRITGYLGTPQGRFKVLLPGGPIGNVPGVDLGSLPPNSLYAVP